MDRCGVHVLLLLLLLLLLRGLQASAEGSGTLLTSLHASLIGPLIVVQIKRKRCIE